MILLHRLTSFVVAALVAASYILLFVKDVPALPFVFITTVVIALLMARLLKWEGKSFSFWVFLGVPMFYYLSSLFFYLYLESAALEIILVVIVSLGIWFYLENLFTFYHLPSAYQAYALEYLTLVLYVLSTFFFASGAYAAQLFLQLPVWVPALAVFWVVLGATIAVFWVSKISTETSVRFALWGAFLLTELYVVFAQLPTSFFTNAALLSIMLYVYLGLSRAQALDKLKAEILKRYLGSAAVFTLIILVTARWT